VLSGLLLLLVLGWLLAVLLALVGLLTLYILLGDVVWALRGAELSLLLVALLSLLAVLRSVLVVSSHGDHWAAPSRGGLLARTGHGTACH
jgi:hypothetical protein